MERIQNRKTAVFPVSCAQPTGNVMLQNSGTAMEIVHSIGLPFRSHKFTTRQISRTTTPYPRKISGSGFQKFISPILSDVEKLAKFNCMIIFQFQLKEVGDIARKLILKHGRHEFTFVVKTAL